MRVRFDQIARLTQYRLISREFANRQVAAFAISHICKATGFQPVLLYQQPDNVLSKNRMPPEFFRGYFTSWALLSGRTTTRKGCGKVQRGWRRDGGGRC